MNLAKFDLPSAMMDYLGQDRNNIAPRAGLAYRLRQGTVLRGGFGIYYNLLNVNWTEQAAFQMPFATVETFEQGSGAAPTFTMSNPFRGQAPFPATPTRHSFPARARLTTFSGVSRSNISFRPASAHG